MAFQTSREGSKFIVDFGTIPVPSAMAAELEGEFQRLALSIIAKIDFRGDLHIGRLPTGVYGYIFEPNGYPFPGDGQGQPELTIYDHTNVIGTLMERPLPVARQFITERKQGQGKPPKPPWDEVLGAILKVLGPPASTRRAIQTTLQIVKAIEDNPLPRSAKTAVERINKQIDSATDIDDLLNTLNEAQRADGGTVEGLGTGLRVAQQMLEDGRATIYNPEFGFYQNFGNPSLVAYSVAKEDVKGAVGGAAGGAVAGSLAGGVGAGPGAVAGAVGGGLGASAAAAVGELLDWLF